MLENRTDQNITMKNEEILQDKTQLQEMGLSNKLILQQSQHPKKQQRSEDISYQCIQACKKGQIKENSSLIIEFLLQNKYLNELEPADGNLLYYISKLVDYIEFETLSGVEELSSMSNSKQYFVISGHALIITPRKGKKLTSKTIWKIKKRQEQEEENKGNTSTIVSETKRKYKENIVRSHDSFGGTNILKGAVVITMSALSVLSCKTEQFQKCFDLLLTRTAFISNCLARTLSFVSLDEIEKEISSKFKELTFEANQLIFSAGEPLSYFYLLRQGCCQVFESDPVNSNQTDSLSSSLVLPSSSSKSFFVKIGEIFGHEDQARVTNNSSTLTRTFFCRCLTSNTIIYAIDKSFFLNSSNSKIYTQILNHAISKHKLLVVQKKPQNILKTQEKKTLQSLLLPSPISAKAKVILKPLLPYDVPPKQFFLQDLSKKSNDNTKYARSPATPNQPLKISKLPRSVDIFQSGIQKQIPVIFRKKLFNEEEQKPNSNRGGSQDSGRQSPQFQDTNSSSPPHILQETFESANSQTTLSSLSIKISNSKEPPIISETKIIEQNHPQNFSSEKIIKISPFSYLNQHDSQLNQLKKPLTPLSTVVVPTEKTQLNNNSTNNSSLTSIVTLNQPDNVIEVMKKPQISQNDPSNTLIFLKKPALKRGGSQISIQSSLSPNIFQSSRSSMRDNTIDRSTNSDKSKLQTLVIPDKRVRFKEQEENHVVIVNKDSKNENTIQTSKKSTNLLLPELTPTLKPNKGDNSPVKRFDYKSNNYRVFKQLSDVTEQRTFPMKKISTSQRNIILSTMNKKY